MADEVFGVRALPSMHVLLDHDSTAVLRAAHPRAAIADALRSALADARRTLLDQPGSPVPAAAGLVARAAALLGAANARALHRVINATGIVLHTNLGRAPLAEAAADAVARIASGYCNLELDLETGERGGRLAAIEALLRDTTGAEAGIAVNNNAAATLLAIASAGAGGGIVVSRGELVEIGGGFRIPDVIRQGGGRLVEVGTTNRTRLDDYRLAIGPDTRVLLKVHQSNYRIVGFTEEVTPATLAELALAHGLVLVHDLGSGCLTRPDGSLAADEPTVREAVAAGADLVTFSGDKLLGGPQAGLIVGRAEALARVRTHPLLRAMRLDKLSAAALEATLRLHAEPGRARLEIPALRILSQSPAAIEARAHRLAGLLAPMLGEVPAVVATSGRTGGGALPEAPIESRAIRLNLDRDAVRRLRLGRPAVVGRRHEGALLLDLLCVSDDEIASLASAIGEALTGAPCGAPA